MVNNKLNVGIVTSSCLLRTGFSNNAKALLPYLWKTGKYNLFQLNQGIGDDPNLNRMPWVNEGVFRQGTFDVNRFNSNDEYYKRCVSYGNLAIESFLLRNKIDILIFVEDCWAAEPTFYFKSKWWKYLKDNTLFHSTADSLPILPLFKEWAENCSNVWFWTSFGVKALHQENYEKYKHVDYTFGSFNTYEYFPIHKHERDTLRAKFNIKPDTKIFLNLNRNQLRKLYPQCLEAFSIFKKNNPDIDAKLHFHCSWSEGGGWSLEKLRNEFGINKEDVLTTYYCRNCKDWNIQPYDGEDKNCPNCKAEKSRITAGVTSSITNEEINLIYNIADANLSIITSGGLELTNVQGLLSGKPLIASNYSCNEDFCYNDFVLSVNGVFTYEVGTGFKKHVPFIHEIVAAYEKICKMSESEISKISKDGREWAIRNFDVNVIGPKFEKWIDSRSKVDWNYEYEPEKPKNPSFPFPVIEDASLFIKTLYKEILNVEVKDDDSGYNDWTNSMKGGRSREDIYNFFIKVAVDDNQKNAASQSVNLKDLLIQNGKKQVLIVARQSYGDIFMITSLFESLRNTYPREEFNLYVASEQKYQEILDGNPYIDKVLNFIPEMDNEILMTGQGNSPAIFDEYLHATSSSQIHLNYLSRTRTALDIFEKGHLST